MENINLLRKIQIEIWEEADKVSSKQIIRKNIADVEGKWRKFEGVTVEFWAKLEGI